MNKILLCIVAGLIGAVSPAFANPVTLSSGSSASPTQTFGGDTLGETGQTAALVLDDSGTTTNVVNIANFVVNNTPGSISESVTLSFNLTLDGVTHTLSQAVNWFITPTQDTINAFEASAPVLFVTSAGNWEVELNSFTMVSNAFGTYTQSVTADFVSVPEPASLALYGLGLLALAATRRRKL